MSGFIEVDDRPSRLALTGFCLALAGPALLFFAPNRGHALWRLIDAESFSSLALLLPLLGWIISVISLFRSKIAGRRDSALSIIVFLLYNPISAFIYYIVCVTFDQPSSRAMGM